MNNKEKLKELRKAKLKAFGTYLKQTEALIFLEDVTGIKKNKEKIAHLMELSAKAEKEYNAADKDYIDFKLHVSKHISKK